MGGFTPGVGVPLDPVVGRSSMNYPVGGGVCVQASSEFTWALRDPTCQFGIINMLQKAADETDAPLTDLDEVIIDTESFIYKQERMRTCAWLAGLSKLAIEEICMTRVEEPSAVSSCTTTCQGLCSSGMMNPEHADACAAESEAMYLHRPQKDHTCEWLGQQAEAATICDMNESAATNCPMVCE